MKHLPLIASAFMLLVAVSACKEKEKEKDPTPATDTRLTFTDSRDNKTYLYVQIGNQFWMQENLRYESVSAGSTKCYDDNSTNCFEGVLYTPAAAAVACPSGWHLPTDAEFRTLEKHIGFSDVDTAKIDQRRGDITSLKSGGSSGFNLAIYPGYYYGGTSPDYYERGTGAYYWLANSYVRNFFNTSSTVGRYQVGGSNAFTSADYYCVRCMKD